MDGATDETYPLRLRRRPLPGGEHVAGQALRRSPPVLRCFEWVEKERTPNNQRATPNVQGRKWKIWRRDCLSIQLRWFERVVMEIAHRILVVGSWALVLRSEPAPPKASQVKSYFAE